MVALQRAGMQVGAAAGSPPLKVQMWARNKVVVENKQRDLGFYLYKSDELKSFPSALEDGIEEGVLCDHSSSTG